MPVSVEFSTIPEMFNNLVRKFEADPRPVLMYKADGKYNSISYPELKRRVDRFACGLSSLGIRRGDRVAIISENRPEWVISDLAIVTLGAVDVPLYPTLTAKQNEFIFKDAGVKCIIVSNQFQLNKVIRTLPDLKGVQRIIIMNDKGVPAESAISFTTVMELGSKLQETNPRFLESLPGTVHPGDLLTIIYTSGTTGNPKGVMLTHGNLVSNVISATKVIQIKPGDRFLSFLPLSHSFERMAGYYAAMACGATIAYAESIETVRENMLEVQPTIIPTVPRLFERIHGRILKQVDGGPSFKKKLFYWAIDVGREYAYVRKQRSVGPGLKIKHAIADKLVYTKLRARTGGKVRFFVSGGAALAQEFGEFFEAVGLKIIEGYGLTETSPVLTVNPLDNYRFGSVGKVIPGVKLKIAPDGEILAQGPNIMQGYWNNPEATKEVIDGAGWFHTGDIGTIDESGFVSITDRKKHLFVSSGGKNIAPQPIENLFLSSKYIDQFVLIGDKRMFLTALIVPDFDSLKEFAASRGLSHENIGELLKQEEIIDLIDSDIDQIQKDLASFERVRKFTLLDKPFTIEDGDLTPTQKIKRKVVEERYAHLIEKMYEGIR